MAKARFVKAHLGGSTLASEPPPLSSVRPLLLFGQVVAVIESGCERGGRRGLRFAVGPDQHFSDRQPARTLRVLVVAAARYTEADPRTYMKVVLIIVLGLYGLAVAGTWLAEQAKPSGAGDFRTLHDLQNLEQQYLRDYQLYCAGKLPESVILQDEQLLRAMRAKLITRFER